MNSIGLLKPRPATGLQIGEGFKRPRQSVEGRKQFFFEKKNQKTFAYWACASGLSAGIKVFCFFFSKKKTFLWLAGLHPIAALPEIASLRRLALPCRRGIRRLP
jgi:hypothetical protein